MCYLISCLNQSQGPPSQPLRALSSALYKYTLKKILLFFKLIRTLHYQYLAEKYGFWRFYISGENYWAGLGCVALTGVGKSCRVQKGSYLTNKGIYLIDTWPVHLFIYFCFSFFWRNITITRRYYSATTNLKILFYYFLFFYFSKPTSNVLLVENQWERERERGQKLGKDTVKREKERDGR